ncbi:sigma factor-like helix-turn-helix DNA-binding protein [Sorangium sp. So ce1024]|uniref:sigma factor-like helix-turn-helix DNA-binding protein n=1 Tax=Sorangium sp. So ce1024 TaxID=3133327 RepID=UPI003F039FDF
MICERSRSRSRATRREVLCDDVDRWGDDRRLWRDEGEPPGRARLCAAVRDAVETALTAKQREVVEAYFFDGLSQGEIARRLGVAQQVVQKRLFGAPRGGRLVGGAVLRLRQALAPALAAAAAAQPALAAAAAQPGRAAAAAQPALAAAAAPPERAARVAP